MEGLRLSTMTACTEVNSNIELKNLEHTEALVRFNNKSLTDSLSKSILYFENYEEYEKCLTLKSILDFCENSPQKTWFPQGNFVPSEHIR